MIMPTCPAPACQSRKAQVHTLSIHHSMPKKYVQVFKTNGVATSWNIAMGSGASKNARAKGFEAPPSYAALRRRRRVLLGAEPGIARDFEQVAPWEQFRTDVSDPVLDRARDTQDLRRSLEDVKDDMGYLRENAMERLELNLRLPSKISRRLYHLARVQQNLGEPRKPQLTCFEVLCLSSALRWSSEAELLELLFCFFDADGDDRVGLDDLTRTIDAFLSLEESSAGFSDVEKKEFRKLDERRRMTEVRRLAQQALSGFALPESEDEDELVKVEGTEAVTKGDTDTKGEVSGDSEGKVQGEANEADKESKAGEKESSIEHQASTSSKLAETGKLEMPQPKKKAGGSLCGRAPKQERPTGFDSESAATQTKPKDKEEGSGEKPKQEVKPKAKAKPKPKAKSAVGLCGVKRPLTLSFKQWSKWILTTEVLPPSLTLVAKEASSNPKSSRAESGPEHVAKPMALAGEEPAPSLALAIPEPKSPAKSDDTPDDDVPSRPLLSAVS